MDKKNSIVVYTAIFGDRDRLHDPKYINSDFDYVCFADRPLRSKVWDVRVVSPIHENPVRAAKIYKILPHKYFQDYNYSLWIDGNVVVTADVRMLIDRYLVDTDMATFDHSESSDSRNCIYDEAEFILEKARRGRCADLDTRKIEEQIKRYREEGYPEQNGLIAATIILRRHNNTKLIKSMEDWWKEIEGNSRRDQLSFNYVAWKNDLRIGHFEGNLRNNSFFRMVPHKGAERTLKKRTLYFYNKIKRHLRSLRRGLH